MCLYENPVYFLKRFLVTQIPFDSLNYENQNHMLEEWYYIIFFASFWE